MGKITKFLFVVLIIVFCLYLVVIKFGSNPYNIKEIIGGRVGVSEIDTQSYYTLVRFFERFRDYLGEKDYASAYNMLNPSYKKYKSADEFKEEYSKSDYSNMLVASIDVVTGSTYHVLADNDGDFENYSIIVNEGTITLLPGKFLAHIDVDKSISKSGIKIKLIDYLVETDKCTFNFDFEELEKKNIKVEKAILTTNLGDKIEIIPESQISFDTDYDFPEKVELMVNIKEKLQNYEFKLEK